MNLDKVYVVDIEAKGFLDKIKTFDDLHVLSVGFISKGSWHVKSTIDKDNIKKILGDPENIIVGHNFFCYDKPALEQAGIEFNATVIDTLGLSYYLYSSRKLHGLEAWGETFGVKKVEIDDEEWENLDYETAVERCEQDVRININLWVSILRLLDELYEGDREKIVKVISLCNFLMEMIREQEKNKILVDIDLANKNRDILQDIFDGKVIELKAIMPKVPKYATRTKPKDMFKKPINMPKKMYTKKGDLTPAGEKWHALLEKHGLPLDDEGPVAELSAAGEKWMNLLDRAKLPADYDGEIKEIVKYLEPNPGSPTQVKEWLFSEGWKPCTFKDGANGPVPQLNDEDKNLTESVLELAEKVPEVRVLAGMSVAKHRLGVIKGIIECADEDNYVVASSSKFTRTFRMAHKKPIVNLPSNTGAYGDLIRKCLIAPEGYFWANADLDSLEDKCKAIQVTPWASEEYLNKPADYDPHLEIAVMAGFMTQEESDFYKYHKKKEEERSIEELPEKYRGWTPEQVKEKMVELGDIRALGKKANYSCFPVDNTEILSKSGWKKYSDLEVGELVMTYNTSKKVNEYKPIEHIHFFENQQIVNMHNNHWQFESTADHRWYGSWRRGTKDLGKHYVDTFKTTSEINSEFNILNAAKFNGGDWKITEDESAFLGWLLSDGYLKWSDKSDVTSSSFGKKKGVKASIAQSKKKYYSEVKALLDGMNIPYRESVNNSGVNVFDIRPKYIRGFFDRLGIPRQNKHDIVWERFIQRMPLSCLESFIDAFYKADGTSAITAKSLVIGQNRGNILEAVKLAAFLAGYKVSRGTKGFCTDVRLSKRATTTGQRILKEHTRKADVFCITTENSTFIARQNGVMTITGNCVYGVGAKTLSKSTGLSVKKAQELIDAYWAIHYPVKEYSKTLLTKTTDGRLWVYSPFTHLWLEIKGEHNSFSAVTQNFGAVVHARMMFFLRSMRIKIIMNIHDEESWYGKLGEEDRHRAITAKAIELVNKSFGFDIPFGSEPEFAASYGDVH